MKFIADFKEDDHITDHYYCRQKQSLKTRADKTYLSLTLQDKTGQIEAKVWDMNNDIASFDERDYIKIDGVVLCYQNALQLKVMKIRKSREGEFDPVDYMPSTDKDIAELYKQLNHYINSIENNYIKTVTQNILIKNEYINRTLKSHSAAKNLHHSYLGGLLEHTVSVASICDFMSTHYKNVKRDLLIATALLHDIGKVFELSPFPDNDYTDEGQLVGHIVICSELIEIEARKIPNFPARLKNLLKHSILAHHGEYEYASPKRPKTIEAYILHCADNMDAKIKFFEETVVSTTSQTNWIGYNKLLARNITKSDW